MTSTLLSTMVDYYNDEEELDSVDDDDDRSFRGRDSEEVRHDGITVKEKERREESEAMTALQDTEDASETDLAKHDEDDYVEIKEQYTAGVSEEDEEAGPTVQREAPKRRQTEQVERNYIKEKKAAVKEFDDKKVELKENLIAELEEKKKMIENEKLTMELTGVSPSSPEHVPSAPMESPSQRYEARIEEGKLYYDKRWYHKSQAIYLESKDNTKISCVISSVGTNEIWVRKTSDSTKMRIYLGQLQRGAFVIRRRSAA
ncbi:hypothetical protein PAMP_021885 [Pampus punctatissimus]